MTGPTIDADDLMRLIDAALAEDVGRGDVTSAATIPAGSTLMAHVVARQPMVVCGVPAIGAVFSRLDEAVLVEPAVDDGTAVGPGALLARVQGPASSVLTGERTALNLMQVLSGIATETRRHVEAMAGTEARLLDTRKTIPGLRLLSKYATAVGGAVNHRMRLDDLVLIKDNHVAAAGSIAAAVHAAFSAGHGVEFVEVECDTPDQAEQAIAAGARHLLLDNFTAADLARLVPGLRGLTPEALVLEASGGVTLETLPGIAASGVDFVSTSRITLGAPAVDIGLDFA